MRFSILWCLLLSSSAMAGFNSPTSKSIEGQLSDCNTIVTPEKKQAIERSCNKNTDFGTIKDGGCIAEQTAFAVETLVASCRRKVQAQAEQAKKSQEDQDTPVENIVPAKIGERKAESGRILAPPITNQTPKSNAQPSKSAEPSSTIENQAKLNGIPAKANTESNNDSTKPSANNSDANAAQSTATTDINSCTNQQQQAEQCVSNPLACLSSADRGRIERAKADQQKLIDQIKSGEGGGIAQACSQLQSLSDDTGGMGTAVGNRLTANQISCSSTCTNLLSKYQELLSSCNGCESESVYSNAIASLSNSVSTCNGLASRTDAVTANGLGMASPSMGAGYCRQSSSFTPSSLNMGGNNTLSSSADPYSSSSNTRTAQAEAVNAARTGNIGFQSASNQNGTANFNLPPQPEGFNNGMGNVNASSYEAPRYKTIANNSGGSIPGSASSSPTKLDNSKVGGGASAPGYSTDVDQGFRSGGYTQAQEAGPDQGGGGWIPNGQGGYRRSSVTASNDPGFVAGLDLKQFLPGGRYYGQRRIAGGVGQRSEINRKEDNLFQIITAKFDEKCKLGRLWKCEGGPVVAALPLRYVGARPASVVSSARRSRSKMAVSPLSIAATKYKRK